MIEFVVERLFKVSLSAGAVFLLLLGTFSTFDLTGAASALPNGVAAGDTTLTSAVLWARATVPGSVLFEYSTDPNLVDDVLTESATVTDPLQPIKVDITGLTPGTSYYYRITDAANASGTGQFETPATVGALAGLRFGVSGDWKGELAPYPSIANADERNLDFFAQLGDSIVAEGAASVTDFRLKHIDVYATHEGLNTWADLRSSTSILATIDDNEIRNDFAGGADASDDIRFPETSGYINDTDIYENGLQAFEEYNPLMDEAYGDEPGDLLDGERKLYRSRTYGRDAAIFVLDTRSFRDKQLSAPTNEIEALIFLNDSFNLTNRTIMGIPQLDNLKSGLLQAQANGITWKFILTPSPIQNLGLFKAHDRFEGYAAERTNLLKFIDDNDIKNVVFVAAGLHGTVVNNLKYQFTPSGTQHPTGAFEIIVGPVAVDPPNGPLGPATIPQAYEAGIVTQQEVDDYNNGSREEQDAFIEEVLNRTITASPLNYDPIGLNGSEIDASLLQGGYVVAHTYGWTEFEINKNTQILTVTTYGIDYYTVDELAGDPNGVTSRTPEIISQFVVNPEVVLVPEMDARYLPLLLIDTSE
jgi:phosphodiesterase/alkaline phosphatase D-like protein